MFLLFPQPLLTIFSGKKELQQIGEYAFRVISLNFVPAGITIVVTSHLQGIAKMKLKWTFPLTELIAAAICIIFEKSKVCQIEVK